MTDPFPIDHDELEETLRRFRPRDDAMRQLFRKRDDRSIVDVELPDE